MNHKALVRSLGEGIAALGQSLPSGADDKLAVLLELLERWGRRINLTAIRTLEDMVPGHVLDSLAVRPYLRGARIADIGTGAGFPGLPLAIAEPEREFVLLDANGKKIAFVQHAIGELGLRNASAVRVRAEDFAPGKRFDTVVARALAKTERLVELGAHLLGEGGVLLALKGQHPAAELDSLPSDWEYSVTEIRVPGLEDHARHLVVLGRNGARK